MATPMGRWIREKIVFPLDRMYARLDERAEEDLETEVRTDALAEARPGRGRAA